MKWFKHFSDAKFDPKLFLLIQKYGLRGYGLYFAILESIAFRLDGSKPLPDLEENSAYIAKYFNEDTVFIEEVMLFCIQNDLFEQDETTGRLLCLKMLAHLDNTLSGNPEIHRIIANFKKLQETSRNLKQIRLDKTRLEEYTSHFEKFWKDYPRKVNKAGAFKAWKTREKEGVDRDIIMKCLKNYCIEVAGKEDTFILHASTFLNKDKRFLDYDKPVKHFTTPERLAMPVRTCPHCGWEYQGTSATCLKCQGEL